MGVRTERGLSQDQLAEQASLDRSYVSGIERTVRKSGIKVVIRLARDLGRLMALDCEKLIKYGIKQVDSSKRH